MVLSSAIYVYGVQGRTNTVKTQPARSYGRSGIKTIKSQWGMLMNDLPGATGLFGILGTGVAGIAAGFLLLRKYLSSDSVERAGDAAQLQIIQMLQDQVKQERARADAASDARDRAVEQISQLRAQVAELSLRVENLKTQMTQAGVVSAAVSK